MKVHPTLKLDGTARPSLALENLQKAERLGGSERVKVEQTIQETLASLYAGQSDSQSQDSTEIVLHSRG
jgi:hypothetical protein